MSAVNIRRKKTVAIGLTKYFIAQNVTVFVTLNDADWSAI